MIKRSNFESLFIEGISEGCRLCVNGGKLVLFISGLCDRKCFYCSLSNRRWQVDRVWANERVCNNEQDAVAEAESSRAEGAGITGGNPLLVFERTLEYTRALKKRFGKNFHIHIYLPTDSVNFEMIRRLHDAGIDEIRFHPYFLKRNLEEEIKKISLAGMFFMKHQIGCELPALPGMEKEVMKFIDVAKNVVGFININELELSDINSDFLIRRGFDVNKDGYTIKGSRETALEILKYCEKNAHIRVHYCSARTKNLHQYRNRLKRRAMQTKKPYDILTRDFTLRRAAFYPNELKPGFGYKNRLQRIGKKRQKYLRRLSLFRGFLIKSGVPKGMIETDKERLRLITSLDIACRKRITGRDKGFAAAYVEELPTWDNTLIQLEYL